MERKIKYYRSLKHQKYRRKHNQFLIEGKRIINEANKNKVELDIVFYTEFFKKKNPNFFDDLIIRGCHLESISKQKMDKISNTKSPSGIIGVCTFPNKKQLNFIPNKWLYLNSISDPGNLGTLLRTAAWFKINNIALSHNSLDPYNPKSIRAGMGAHFHLTIHSDININIFKKNNYHILGADHRGEILTQSFKIPERWVLVLGNEAHGISKEINKKLDKVLAIPKPGTGDSLNISIAGAILMHQLSKK